MAMKIDPDCLFSLRKKRGWSRPQLAKRSGITVRTIQRLESKSESQRCQKTREDTLNRLAKALGIEAGVLTGDMPLPESGKTPVPDSERVQIGAQIAPKARLAYDLIKRRYGVSATEIINMAPLFFALLAEGSLAWRSEKLKEVEETKSRLGQIDGFWRGGTLGWVGEGTLRDEGVAGEEDSIAKADLFGEHLIRDPSIHDFFDPSTDNPFASYLRKLKAELDIAGVVDVDSGSFMFGSPLKFPDYDICRDELDGIASGSHNAKMALETGDARLSEIPEELMMEDAGEDRAKWLEDKLSDTLKEIEGEMGYCVAKLIEGHPEGASEKHIEELGKELGPLATYRMLLSRGISDPDGALRKRIEEYDITNEELDRLLAGEPLEETDSQKTNSAIEKGGDDR